MKTKTPHKIAEQIAALGKQPIAPDAYEQAQALYDSSPFNINLALSMAAFLSKIGHQDTAYAFLRDALVQVDGDAKGTLSLLQKLATMQITARDVTAAQETVGSMLAFAPHQQPTVLTKASMLEEFGDAAAAVAFLDEEIAHGANDYIKMMRDKLARKHGVKVTFYNVSGNKKAVAQPGPQAKAQPAKPEKPAKTPKIEAMERAYRPRKAEQGVLQNIKAMHLSIDPDSDASLNTMLHRCNEYLRDYPKDVTLYERLGHLYTKHGLREEAMKLLQRARAELPFSTEIHRQIALLHAAREEWEKVRDISDAILARNSSNLVAIRLKANALDGMGLPVEARNFYTYMISKKPKHVELILEYAAFLKDHGRYRERFEVLRPVMQFAPSNRMVFAILAHQMREDNNPQEGIEICNAAIAGNPKFTHPYMVRAMFFMMQGRAREAERSYDEALAINPAESAALSHKLTIMLDRDDPAGAEAVVDRAVAHAPANPQIIFTKARLAFYRGHFPRTAEILQPLLQGWNHQPSVLLFLACTDEDDPRHRVLRHKLGADTFSKMKETAARWKARYRDYSYAPPFEKLPYLGGGSVWNSVYIPFGINSDAILQMADLPGPLRDAVADTRSIKSELRGHALKRDTATGQSFAL